MPPVIAILLAAALAAQALPAPAATEGWEVLLTDQSGETRIDRATVQRDGDVIRVTTYTALAGRRPDGYVAAAARVAIDCARQIYAFERIAIYNDAGSLGERTPDGGPRYAPVSSQEIPRRLYALLCPGAVQ